MGETDYRQERRQNRRCVARIVGDAVVGSDTIDSVGEKVEGVGNAVSNLGETASNAMNSVSEAVGGASNNLNGISNFLGSMTNGNGFFSNLFSGNVSGMSMLGLVASAFLIFGRFGWMGKIAGALLGMMMIGNNATLHQALGGGMAQQKPQTPAPDPQRALAQNQTPQVPQPVVVYAPEEERTVIQKSMKFTQDMMLQSDSGYCMPFEEKGKDVEMSLGYGKQKHPKTGEMFFHHGVDFPVKHYLLSALATGKVTGLGNDAVHGIYQVIRYGLYEVTYSHLSNVFANYGTEVKAGQVVAVSADLLHMEVKYNGVELNPLEFLTMVYGNMKALEQNGTPGAVPQFVTIDMDVHTKYDKDQKEIEDLMMRWFPDYMQDLSSGIYALPEHTELALRNIFTMSAMKNYFFETLPSMANPLGMGTRSIPLAEKVQNLLIADFLNYMALRHQIFLSTMSEAVKKKPMTKP